MTYEITPTSSDNTKMEYSIFLEIKRARPSRAQMLMCVMCATEWRTW